MHGLYFKQKTTRLVRNHIGLFQSRIGDGTPIPRGHFIIMM